MTVKTKKLSLSLTEPIYQAVMQEAKKRGAISAQEMMRVILIDWFREHKVLTTSGPMDRPEVLENG